MARRRPPSEPLVVILGSTGTGKSDLAVDLAVRFDGEIINADAMQMYQGLPIITNKISEKDRRGVPHHLIGSIGLDEESWTVGVFKRVAERKIREIRSRGKLPIVVGGTHYYTNGLLFKGGLIDESPAQDDEGTGLQDYGARFPILEGPTEAMLEKLREVDPAMAERWHPNDRRKIRRSLEIYLSTGRRASDIYAEQQRQKQSRSDHPQRAGEPGDSWESLLLLASGEHVDRTKGIWQSIGFKQFEPYLRALAKGSRDDDAAELEKLKQAGLDETKSATRQYARYQTKWITKKTLPLLREEGAFDSLYLLDSTHVERWDEEVSAKAAELTRRFLAGDELPPPAEICAAAEEVLLPHREAVVRQETPCQRRCELCGVTLMTEELWQKHIRGRGHRRAAYSAKRTALVAASDRPPTSLAVAEQSALPE
ncbi:hypothetical protein VTK73DRAFT_7060 [Phialemonium thermophilum]|uniref:tRNA dimethylallyltransferase n=1 Tax=Phialemonium thermophilum TaxID=223376 RepID=A0ABR3WGT2_9PEZI